MRNISLRAKLMLVCAGLVLVPVLLVSLYSLMQLSGFSEAATSQSREGLVTQAKELLGTGAQATWEEVNALLASTNKDAGQFAESGNVRGYIMSRAGRNKVLNDIAMREVERVAQGIAMACKVEGDTGQEGTAAAAKKAVAEELLKVKIGQTGYAFVLDSAGKTLIHPSDKVVGKSLVKDLGLTELTPILSDRQEGVVKTLPYSFQGRAKILAYTYYPAWGWIVCAGAYLDELSADAARASLTFLRADMEAIYANANVTINGKRMPVYSQLRLLDKNGQEMIRLANGEFTEKLTSKGNTDWFRATRSAKEGTIVNGGCAVSDNTGKPELRLSVPILVDGDFMGAVALNVDWSVVTAVVGKRVFGKTGYAYIINEKGILISHPQYALEDGKNLSGGTDKLAEIIRNEMLKGKEGVSEYTFEGKDKYAAYLPLKIGPHDYCLAASSFTDEFLETANAIDKQAQAMSTKTRWSLIVAGIVLLAIGVLVGLFFANGLSKALTHIVGILRAASEQVTAASGQISQSSQQLAEGSTEQAASLEESSAALEELASQARGNSDKAKKAAEGADNMRQGAQEASRAMEQTVEAMNAIKESSDRVSGIVRSIEEIAFQTNLLALNAAVEAARAGEHGKGFAVVAEEVRNLAQRAAQAARDTSGIIGKSVEQSNRGAEVVQEAAEGLNRIREESEAVAELAREVLSASDEQGQGIEQINTAVAQMDQVTQAVAANAEESASASEELSAQAGQMDSIVLDLDSLVAGSGTSNGGPTHGAQHHATLAHRAAPGKRLGHAPAPKKANAPAPAEAQIPFDDDDDISKDF